MSCDLMAIFFIVIGAPLIPLGIWAIKDPDNWWFRVFRKIPDNVDQDDVALSLMRLRGVIALIAGVIITLFGVQRFFIYSNPVSLVLLCLYGLFFGIIYLR